MGWLFVLAVIVIAAAVIAVVVRSQPRPRAAVRTRDNVVSPPRVSPAPLAPAAGVQQPAATRIAPIQWAGVGSRVHIDDVTVNNPLVYVTDSREGVRSEEPAAIDLALKVAAHTYQPTQRELPYWPRYDVLSPGQRRIYLEWLAAGRQRIPPELGYTFLFIYGFGAARTDRADGPATGVR